MTLPSEVFRSKLSPYNQALHDWVYEWSRNPVATVMLVGCMEAFAADKPNESFWNILAAAKERLDPRN